MFINSTGKVELLTGRSSAAGGPSARGLQPAQYPGAVYRDKKQVPACGGEYDQTPIYRETFFKRI